MFRISAALTMGGLLVLTSAAPSAEGAFLEGKMITAALFHITNPGDQQTGVVQKITVGSGVELPGFGERTSPDLPALVDIDFTDTQIRITLVIDQPPAVQEGLQFTDVADNLPPIKKVLIDPQTNWADFTDPLRVMASTEGITVNLVGLPGLAGQQIVLNVVPEPTSGALAAAAGAGLAAVGRKRKA